MGEGKGVDIPFLLKLVPKLKYLDFDLTLTVVLQNPLIWLPLAVLQVI
jgi:hypothetical protein